MEPGSSVNENVKALQQLMHERRKLSSALLSADAYERWGARSDADRAAIGEEISTLSQQHSKVQQTLTKLVEQLRKTDPAALEAWISAHERLLQEYIERLARDPTRDTGTERFVANGELKEWQEVREGKRAYCDENVYYVNFDGALYEQLFGLSIK